MTMNGIAATFEELDW